MTGALQNVTLNGQGIVLRCWPHCPGARLKGPGRASVSASCLALGSQPILVGDKGSWPSSPLAHPNSSWLFVPRAGDLGGPGVQRAEGWALALLFPREPLAVSGTLTSPVPGAGEGPGKPVMAVELGDTCLEEPHNSHSRATPTPTLSLPFIASSLQPGGGPGGCGGGRSFGPWGLFSCGLLVGARPGGSQAVRWRTATRSWRGRS